MRFQFTQKEEKLLIISLLLHQYKNRTLVHFEGWYHPITSTIVKKSQVISAPKELVKPLKEYHPCHFVTWLYGGKEQIFTKRQIQLLKKLIKGKDIYSLIKINKQKLKKLIIKEEKKWANGLKFLKSARPKLPFPQSVNLVLNLFQGLGEGYGIKTNKRISYIIIGPHYGKSPADQVILHEYLHIIFGDWFKSDKGKKIISLLLKGLLKNKWRSAKRPWYPDKKTVTEEYFIRALTLRFLPENLKPLFIKEQNNQGFKEIIKVFNWGNVHTHMAVSPKLGIWQYVWQKPLKKSGCDGCFPLCGEKSNS